ncbi:MAG: hypothetical protein AAFX65_13190 [Cyanobacteria bacterium J06638_7]
MRFLADGQSDSIAQEQLLFAGALESPGAAMDCSSDGRCTPRWPAWLTVASVADTRFDQRGLVMGLPRSHLARGHCQLERTRVQCRAEAPGGDLWIAEASLDAAAEPLGSGPH